MKKIAILFCFLFHFFSGKSQISSFFMNEWMDTVNVHCGIALDGFINANSLSTDFINKFYSGDYIDTHLKDKIGSRTKNSNRAGAELNYGLFTSFKLDSLFRKNQFHLFLGIRDRQHFDIHFSKDLYNTAFYGNAMYAGKIADLSDFNLNLLRYQQFQIGLVSTPATGARWGIGLSFLKGEQYQQIDAKRARLFTSADAQYIDFETQIEMSQSDFSNKGLNAFNGFGLGVDLYLETPFKTPLGNSKFCVSVSDIGLIRFNKNSVYRNQDSVFHYTGFQVKSIFDLQDSIFFNTSQDSIQNKILPSARRSVTATLPSTLNFYQETEFNTHFHFIEGVRYIFNANYKALLYIKGIVYFNKNILSSITIGYGGYGGLNCGIGVSANLGSGFSIYAGSNNLEGFFAPSKMAGRAAYFSIIKNFN